MCSAACFKLRDEVCLFLMENGSQLTDHLTDPDWLTRLAYLACILKKLNGLNISLQGENTNNMLLNDKSHKLERWTERVEMGRIYMFSELDEFMEENELSVNIVKKSITTHL